MSENLMPSMTTLDTFHLGAGDSPLETSRDRWSHKIPTLTTHTPTLGMVTWLAMQDKEGFPHKIISSDRPGTIPTGPRDIMATHTGGLNQNSSQMIIAVIPIRVMKFKTVMSMNGGNGPNAPSHAAREQRRVIEAMLTLMCPPVLKI